MSWYVVDEEGHGVAGTVVLLVHGDKELDIRADAKGTFVLPTPPLNESFLVVCAPHFEMSCVPLTQADWKGGRVQLLRKTELEGKIIGVPASLDLTFYLVRTDVSKGGRMEVRPERQAEGHFWLPEIELGTYQIQFDSKEYELIEPQTVDIHTKGKLHKVTLKVRPVPEG